MITPFFGVHHSNLLLLLVSFSIGEIFISCYLVGRGLFRWLWRTYNYISFVLSPIPSPYRVRLVDFFFLLLFWPGVGLFNISKNKDVVGTSLVSRGQIRR